MTVRYDVVILCDWRPVADSIRGMCHQEEHGAGSLSSPPALAEARQEVEDEGWVRKHGPSSCAYDLCPDHAEEQPGVTFPDWRK